MEPLEGRQPPQSAFNVQIVGYTESEKQLWVLSTLISGYVVTHALWCS
jgi:hypothetical protein